MRNLSRMLTLVALIAGVLVLAPESEAEAASANVMIKGR